MNRRFWRLAARGPGWAWRPCDRAATWLYWHGPRRRTNELEARIGELEAQIAKVLGDFERISDTLDRLLHDLTGPPAPAEARERSKVSRLAVPKLPRTPAAGGESGTPEWDSNVVPLRRKA